MQSSDAGKGLTLELQKVSMCPILAEYVEDLPIHLTHVPPRFMLLFASKQVNANSVDLAMLTVLLYEPERDIPLCLSSKWILLSCLRLFQLN